MPLPTQVLPGGSPDDPLNSIRAMSRDQLSTWARDNVAAVFGRTLYSELEKGPSSPSFRSVKSMLKGNVSDAMDDVTLSVPGVEAGVDEGGAGGVGGKFAGVGEKMEDWTGKIRRTCKFGAMEEFYQGLSSKIGLPHLRSVASPFKTHRTWHTIGIFLLGTRLRFSRC